MVKFPRLGLSFSLRKNNSKIQLRTAAFFTWSIILLRSTFRNVAFVSVLPLLVTNFAGMYSAEVCKVQKVSKCFQIRDKIGPINGIPRSESTAVRVDQLEMVWMSDRFNLPNVHLMHVCKCSQVPQDRTNPSEGMLVREVTTIRIPARWWTGLLFPKEIPGKEAPLSYTFMRFTPCKRTNRRSRSGQLRWPAPYVAYEVECYEFWSRTGKVGTG